ncbi:MAG: CocE/NonD family hydrolase [Dehalococcoidales bacterium]|nr:CocE/NonD family hydrolase [Dehalococcoidales bacterium]
MSITDRIIGRILKLPPAECYDIVVERGLKIPVTGGVELLADHYFPLGSARLPTVLIRCPYGRTGTNALGARLLAERGFQVLLQSCRGTFGSGGQFKPFFHEHDDGLASLEWMKKQDWFSGELATFGSSYLGYVQWAIAADAGPVLKAMAAQISASRMQGLIYPGESFALSNCITWNNIIHTQEKSRPGDLFSIFTGSKLKPVYRHLPLGDADEMITGQKIQFWQDLLEHGEPGDAWWDPADHSRSIAGVTAPVNLIGGWYDIFLPWMIEDYISLRKAGRTPYLMIGPWSHLSSGVQIVESMRESVIWLKAHLSDDRSRLREKPVRIYVMGLKKWRDFDDWPPPGYPPQDWYLQPGGGLALRPPDAAEPDGYRYDPADPTPNIGGAVMNHGAGSRDNRPLEARQDVLVYTSAALDRDLDLIGPVSATLYVRSSLENTDFFVRLCDVHPSGKSFNICDGIRRLRPGRPAAEKDGTIRVDIEMWPTAHRFMRNHRVRLQVSSGAHPRFARNPGSGEPLSTAVSLRVAGQTVYHDQMHPSRVTLPGR